MEEKGEINSHGGDRKSTSRDVNLNSQPAPLPRDERSIPRMERHRFKTLADMHEEVFEKHIAEKIENKEELTSRC